MKLILARLEMNFGSLFGSMGSKDAYIKMQLKFNNPMNSNGAGRGMKMM